MAEDMLTNEKLKLWIEEDERRDRIMRGLYQRYVLKPAASDTPDDPRMSGGVPILARKPQGAANVNHKLHTPFDRMITNAKASYYASNVRTTFSDEIPEFVVDYYEKINQVSDWEGMYLENAESATDRGTSYVLLYNLEGEIGVTNSLEWHTKVLYDPLTDIPVMGIRYYEKDVEVYDGQNVYYYKRDTDGNLNLSSKTPHGFGTEDRPGIPIVELPNNKDRLGNVEMTLSLQDAHDVALSDLSSEVAQMRLAYLLLKGLGRDGDNNRLKEQIKKAGIIIVDSGDGDAKFISKDLKVEGIQLLLETLRLHIFEGADSYDPNAFIEGSSPTAYQVAQRLHPMEQDSQRTVGLWKRHLKYYDYLVQTFLMTFKAQVEYTLSNIDRVFVRNIPQNALGALKEAKSAGIVLANEILIEQSGLEVDIERNLKLLEEPKEVKEVTAE